MIRAETIHIQYLSFPLEYLVKISSSPCFIFITLDIMLFYKKMYDLMFRRTTLKSQGIKRFTNRNALNELEVSGFYAA